MLNLADWHAGSLHSFQADIERLSDKLQSMSTGAQSNIDRREDSEDTDWQQLSAQCDRLMRNSITLHSSQPGFSSWAWMAEDPPGTTVGNLKQRIKSLEESLAAVQR